MCEFDPLNCPKIGTKAEYGVKWHQGHSSFQCKEILLNKIMIGIHQLLYLTSSMVTGWKCQLYCRRENSMVVNGQARISLICMRVVEYARAGF